MENGFHPQRPQFHDQPAAHDPVNILTAALVSNSAPNPVLEEQQQQQNQQDLIDNASQQDQSQRIKRKRASKACDACRVRKVKCDVSKNPCPQCAEHNIPCEYTAPVKKRGPPNAYVELQRQRLEMRAQGLPYQPEQSVFEEKANNNAIAQYSVVYPQTDRGLEELAPPHILNLMFDDFFQYVYPIAPIIVESAFRRVLSTQTLHTNDFLALASSVLGCTLACLRSSEAQYGGLTVEHTYQFALSRLGLHYRDRMNLEIAATIQYLSVASAYSHLTRPLPENTRSAFLDAEFSTAIRVMSATQLEGMNFMEQQLFKRMYQYLTYIEMSQNLQGQTKSFMHTRHRQSLDDSMRPLDLSDEQLDNMDETVDQGSHVKGGSLAKSYVPGMLLLCDLFSIYTESFEIRHDKALPAHTRYLGLCETLHKIQHCLDDAPLQLRLEEYASTHGSGFEVQRANLLISKMYVSSSLLEQCYTLHVESATDDAPAADQTKLDLETQRRTVISETLQILKSIATRALEANGSSMITRIRQVASILVGIIQGQNGTEQDNTTAKKELAEFVEILGTLDQAEKTQTDTESSLRLLIDS